MPRSLLVRVALVAAIILLASGCQKRAGDNLCGFANPGQWSGFSSTPGPILVGHAVKFSDMTESERKFARHQVEDGGIMT